MANIILSLSLLCLLIFTNSGSDLKFTRAQEAGEMTWCIAKPSTPDDLLQIDINYACGNLESCAIIQAHGACFYPNNLANHASVAMNMYYQRAGRNYWNCDFNGTGILTTTDPSYGDCKYEYDGPNGNK